MCQSIGVTPPRPVETSRSYLVTVEQTRTRPHFGEPKNRKNKLFPGSLKIGDTVFHLINNQIICFYYGWPTTCALKWDSKHKNEHVGLCFHIFFPFSLCQSLDPDFRHIRQKISETAHAASIRVFEPLFLFRRENADEPGEWKLHRDSQGWRSGNIFRGKNQGNIHS